MKSIPLLCALCGMVLFTQCKKDSETATPKVTTLCAEDEQIILSLGNQNNISIEFPACFEVSPLQGIDTYVGKIEAIEQGVSILYDIGFLAGEYVDATSSDQETVEGAHETFRYEIVDDRLIFTFPDAGPANFYTNQTAHKDDLVEFFKSLKVD